MSHARQPAPHVMLFARIVSFVGEREIAAAFRAVDPFGIDDACELSPTGQHSAIGSCGDRSMRARDTSNFTRAFKRFQSDQMTDRAAALTYYSLLSLFPALLFGVAALGYFGGQGLITDASDYLTALSVRWDKAIDRLRAYVEKN